MKKEFNRTDGLFSLCGLNCGLCPMQIRGDCSGCFNGSTCYQSCPLAPCSVRHGGVQYCFECPVYPCKKYDGIDRYDSLISHRNQKADLMKAKQMGIEAYLQEQRSKKEILDRLLDKYDDGTHDVFFCLVVNMFEVEDLAEILEQADRITSELTEEEKAAFITKQFRAFADRNGIPLKMRH